jgi:hypothetical protein
VSNSNFRLVLLRGLDVDRNTYPLGDLINHCMELLDIDYSNSEMGELYRRLGIEQNHDVQQQRQELRRTVKDMFVEGRSLALQGLRNGLDLGGEYSMTRRSAFSGIHMVKCLISLLR